MAALAGATLLIVVAAFVIARQQDADRVTPIVSATTGAPSPSATPSPTPSVSASVSPSPSPSPAASPQAFATVAPGQLDAFVPVRTRGIGELSGDWVFMVRRSTIFGTLPHPSGAGQVALTDHAVDDLILIPLAGPESRVVSVATFLSDLGGGIVATNQIASQLSPNGDRVVLSVGTKGPQGGERLGLVIIDLASGNTFNLTTDASYHDDTPAWSPDGKWIAFSRRTASDGRDAAVWIVAPTAGAQPRALMSPQVDQPGRRTFVYGWTPDGRFLAMTRGHEDIEFWDASFTGVCAPPPAAVCAPPPMTSFNGVVSGSRAAIDWRAKAPQFVGAFAEQPNGSGAASTVAVADGPASSLRTVVRASSGGSLLRPRWRPGSDDVLYLESAAPSGTGDHKVVVVDTTTGVSRQIAAGRRPMFMEWTPDGSSVAWAEATGVAFGVRIVSSDGSGERVIHSGGGAPEASISTVDFGTLRL